MSRVTPKILRAQADELERVTREKTRKARDERMMNQFSKWVVAGVMLMFFVGVALGCYSVIRLGESVQTVLNYIERLAVIAFLGYFIKAFGENIAKIVLSFLVGKRQETNNNDTTGGSEI
jgi:TctA family transporter